MTLGAGTTATLIYQGPGVQAWDYTASARVDNTAYMRDDFDEPIELHEVLPTSQSPNAHISSEDTHPYTRSWSSSPHSFHRTSTAHLSSDDSHPFAQPSSPSSNALYYTPAAPLSSDDAHVYALLASSSLNPLHPATSSLPLPALHHTTRRTSHPTISELEADIDDDLSDDERIPASCENAHIVTSTHLNHRMDPDSPDMNDANDEHLTARTALSLIDRGARYSDDFEKFEEREDDDVCTTNSDNNDTEASHSHDDISEVRQLHGYDLTDDEDDDSLPDPADPPYFAALVHDKLLKIYQDREPHGFSSPLYAISCSSDDGLQSPGEASRSDADTQSDRPEAKLNDITRPSPSPAKVQPTQRPGSTTSSQTSVYSIHTNSSFQPSPCSPHPPTKALAGTKRSFSDLAPEDDDSPHDTSPPAKRRAIAGSRGSAPKVVRHQKVLDKRTSSFSHVANEPAALRRARSLGSVLVDLPEAEVSSTFHYSSLKANPRRTDRPVNQT